MGNQHPLAPHTALATLHSSPLVLLVDRMVFRRQALLARRVRPVLVYTRWTRDAIASRLCTTNDSTQASYSQMPTPTAAVYPWQITQTTVDRSTWAVADWLLGTLIQGAALRAGARTVHQTCFLGDGNNFPFLFLVIPPVGEIDELTEWKRTHTQHIRTDGWKESRWDSKRGISPFDTFLYFGIFTSAGVFPLGLGFGTPSLLCMNAPCPTFL